MATRQLLYVRPPSMTSALQTDALGQDWEVHACGKIAQARDLSEDDHFPVGLVLLDGWDSESQQALEELLLEQSDMRWVALVSEGTLDQNDVRHLVSQGFYDFHTLPPDMGRLRMTLGHAYGMATLSSTMAEDKHHYGMVGESPVMQQLYRTIGKAALVNAPVLVQGESGTGKELAALAIHQLSARAEYPFIAVNCAALPGNLIQSELFGHERGAFTGATQRKIGKIEMAASGSIFLDEIGDVPMDLQVNLLRFLQDRRIERVGGTESISVDVRVIAATHVDLQRAVDQGRFREDLFYRLNVLRLDVPPLRARTGDVELLAKHTFNEFRSERHPRIRGFSRGALRAMNAYLWPGNVRELINRVRHAMVMSEEPMISAASLGLEQLPKGKADLTLDKARDVAERSVVESTLRRARQNVSEAARQLGISRVTMYRLMTKYGLRS